MDKYIKREEIMKFPIRKDHCDKEHANEHFIFGIESVLEYIENLPIADVKPIVHGRWYSRKNGCLPSGVTLTGVIFCLSFWNMGRNTPSIRLMG